MIIRLSDGLKHAGIAVVCFCAVFVTTFMLNFYLDVSPIVDGVPIEALPLMQAQVATAKFTSILTGCALGAIAAVMVFFYIKLYIDSHGKQLGVLKALGYPRTRIALCFWVFGLSAFVGCALGYAAGVIFCPKVYEEMTVSGLATPKVGFHVVIPLALVLAPTAAYMLLSCLYAYCALGMPVIQLLRGKQNREKPDRAHKYKDRPFLNELAVKSLSAKKSVVFFTAFSGFCFGAMIQMGISMTEYSDTPLMSYMILVIGVIIAAVTMIMSATTLINANKQSFAVMKAFGYRLRERALYVLGPYAPFAVLGFGLGTAYQYGLMQLMVNLVFADVAEVPHYTFGVGAFFISFAVFIAAYAALAAVYTVKIGKVSVKEIMTEN